MKKYIYNVRSNRVHVLADGRSYESCNLDQIPPEQRKERDSIAELLGDYEKAVACKRCFPQGFVLVPTG